MYERKRFLIIQCFLLMVSFFMMSSASAAWTGPVTVLSGSWGNGSTEFYVDWGDGPTYETYPKLWSISDNGNIAIADNGNNRVKIYDSNGVLISNVSPVAAEPGTQIYEPIFVGKNIAIQADKYYFYTVNGTLVAQLQGPTDTEYLSEYNGQLYIAVKSPEKLWLVYSQEGALLNTFKEKPVELNRIGDERFIYQGSHMHRVTVQSPNKKWVISSKSGNCGEYGYRADSSGNLYCVGDNNIERYSACGIVVSQLTVPETTKTVEDSGDPGADPDVSVIEEYDSLKIDNNGNLYASKITQDNYAVVKWVWQNSPSDPIGGPDAPINLIPALNAPGTVTVGWTYSLQDPGCVTAYEIDRATTAGGPYTQVGTVPVGDITKGYKFQDSTVHSGTTYYYVVHAKSGLGDSPNSNELKVTAQ